MLAHSSSRVAFWQANASILRSHQPKGYPVSHPLSLVQRGFIRPPLTAIPRAFRWPMTTSRLPQVSPA
jgi:hypothetical protein